MNGHRVMTATLLLGLSASLLAQAGAPVKKPSFDVASIKPNKSASGGGWSSSGGRQTIINTTAGILVSYAFDLHDYEIADAPPWLHTDRLDVIVQTETPPTEEESRVMMQSLLEERFALKAHREARDGPNYRLTLARKDGTLGPQLLKSGIDCAELRRRGDKPPAPPASVPWAVSPCGMRMSSGEMVMGARLFPDFVGSLESLVKRRIADETGLSGAFDIKLEWNRGPNDVERPSIFTAIQEQLGLKLEPSRGPVNVLVIDSISRPTPD